MWASGPACKVLGTAEGRGLRRVESSLLTLGARIPPTHRRSDQVQELELSVDLKSLDKLLEFLACE